MASSAKIKKRADARKSRKEGRKALKAAAHYLRFGPKGTSASSSSAKKKRGPQNAFGTKKTPSTKKLHLGGPNPVTQAEHKTKKQNEAKVRKDNWVALGYEQQLVGLDIRLNVLFHTVPGEGAIKERARILRKLKTEVKKAAIAAAQEVVDTVAEDRVKLKAKERIAKEKKGK